MSYVMYNKLFTKILDSSIWMEDVATRIVWITFLAAMDEDGFVRIASPANVAHKARVSLEEAKHALERLEGPDDCSFDPDNEGRRLERVEGGWIVLNAPKYRDLVTRQVIREQTKERVRKFREKKAKAGNVTSNADVTPSEAVSISLSKAVSTNHPESVRIPAESLTFDLGSKDATQVPKDNQNPQNNPATPESGNPPHTRRPPLPLLKPINAPMRSVFERYIEEHCPLVQDNDPKLWDRWDRDNFHLFKKGRWEPIYDWQKTLNGLEATMEGRRTGS